MTGTFFTKAHTRNNCRLVHVFPTNLAGGLANLGRGLPTKMSTKKPTSANRDENTYETNSSAPTLQQAYEETASKSVYMYILALPIPKNILCLHFKCSTMERFWIEVFQACFFT